MTVRKPLVAINGKIHELPTGDTVEGATGGGGGGLTAADLAISGTATVDFGSYPGDVIATTTVMGQDTIGTNAQIDAWIMGVDSADHNAYEHMIAPIQVRAGNIVPGVGFDIFAVSTTRLTGQFAVQWVRTK